MSGKVLVACPVLVLLTASAWAGTITDPSAGVEAGGFSNPISGVTSFNPAGDPGHPGEIGLYNDTGALITGLSLSTTISTGLDSTTVANDFNCNDANTALFPNPFFRCAEFIQRHWLWLNLIWAIPFFVMWRVSRRVKRAT